MEINIAPFATHPNARSAFKELTAVRISPNPTHSLLQVSAAFSSVLEVHVVVRDLLGREVFRAFAKTDQLRSTLDVSAFPPDIYLLSLQSGRRIYTERIVVE